MRTLILCVAVLSLTACKKSPEAAAESAVTAASAVTPEAEAAAEVAVDPCPEADTQLEQRPDVAEKEMRDAPDAPGCPKTDLVEQVPVPDAPMQPDLPQ